MSKEVAAVGFDSQLEALRYVERRRLLLVLLETNPDDEIPLAIEQVAEERDARDFLVTMHHIHLSKLGDLEVIGMDDERRHVGRGLNFDAIEPLLQFLDEHREELPADWM